MTQDSSWQWILIKLAGLPLVLCIESFVRMCSHPMVRQAMANALETQSGLLLLKTRWQSIHWRLNDSA